MSDKIIFGCAETGTYQTSAPNPHIELSGTASSSFSIAQLFADAMSSDETATISIVKDKDNWAVYGGAKFTNDTVDTLDLSVATLLESKGTLSDEDAVTCLGLAPNRRMLSTKVYLNSTAHPSSSAETKVPLDTVEWDEDGWWNANNTRIIPKKAGYYLVNAGVFNENSNYWLYGHIMKNGSIYCGLASPVVTLNGALGGNGSTLIYFNGSTDYVELFAKGSSTNITFTAANWATFISLMGPLL